MCELQCILIVFFFFGLIYLVLMMVNVYTRLDYPGVGPEHSFLKDIGRAEYHSVTDEEALEGIRALPTLSVALNMLIQ